MFLEYSVHFLLTIYNYPDGSLKSDANKGITLIEYNYLSLPEKIHFGSSKRIENIYDAEGVKLEQRLINGGSTHSTEYIGDLIYVNGILQTIMHDEGRVKVEGSSNRYQFFITDHLGSTRIIIERISDTAALVQELHYGVWGEKLEGIGINGDWNFLFQGKEYIDFEGYDAYDFHSRSYDPWTGRFNQIDGANQFASGYVGMANNPLSYIDPDGQIAFLAAVGIAAAISAVTYTASVAMSPGGFSQNWNWGQFAKSVGIGAVSGAVSFGVGSLAAGMEGFGKLAFQTAAHATWGGANSALNGGSFWSGAASGALGSAWGGVSGGMNPILRTAGASVVGGLSSQMTGGDFWTGSAIGLMATGLNHMMHDDPPGKKNRFVGNGGKELDPLVVRGDVGYNPNHGIRPTFELQDVAAGAILGKAVGKAIGYVGSRLFSKGVTNTLPRTESVLGHIFRDASGHVNPSTLTSQSRYINLFEKVANNPRNLNQNILRPSAIQNGVQGFTQNFKNGQVWVHARNGRIFDAGVNLTPR